MRARQKLLLLIAAVAGSTALIVPAVAKRGDVIDWNARKFDHAAHFAAEQAKSGKVTPCNEACHTTGYDGPDRKRKSRAEHKRCETCHKLPLDCGKLKAGAGKLCVACHNIDREKCLPAGTLAAQAKVQPLFRIAEGARKGAVIATYSHKTHARPGSSTADQCGDCHGKLGERKGASLSGGHAFCSGCHERGARPRMTGCDGCHKAVTSDAGKTPVVAARPPNPYAARAFDHKGHAGRVGPEGRSCLTCHANIASAASNSSVPMPTMQDCYKSCHDGKKAFSATGTHCTKCHSGGGPR